MSLAVVTAAFSAACGKDSPSGPDTIQPGASAGIYFVRGSGATDTAGTQLVQALVVEVYSARGILAPKGTVVRFTSVGSQFSPEAFIGRLTGSASSSFTTDSLDVAGRAAIIVKLGFKAGPARIEVNVPTFGMVDTAEYTVLPGKASRITVKPSDTTVYLDASYTITGTVTDQYGNSRSDPVSWSVPQGSLATVSSSGMVTPNVTGRHSVIATAGTATATAMVSALPRLKLVAYRTSPSPAIVSMDLDGTNQTHLASIIDGGIGAHPVWISGANVVYSSLTGSYQLLRRVDQAGVVNPFIAAPLVTMTHQAEPTPTASGNYLFFSGFDSRCGEGSDYCLFRSGVDGSNPQLVSTDFGRQPAPSPDGSKVAFTHDAFSGTIRVLDVASLSVSAWSVTGQYPSWSPDGTRIAFPAGGRIMTIKPDGSGLLELTPATRLYSTSPISWSPDGKWIIAKGGNGPLELIDATTGAALPLSYSSSFVAPSLR